MKSIFLFYFFMILIIPKVNGQTYISLNHTTLINYTINFIYSGDDYIPSESSYSEQSLLSARQDRYNYYHSMFSKEYIKLRDLSLINAENRSILSNYRNARLQKLEQAITTSDLSIQSISNNILNGICEIYSYSSIRDELNLLRSCSKELIRMKYLDENRDNYLYSKRYKSIMKTLELLENCSNSEIKNLSWEKIELDIDTDGNTLNSKTNLDYKYESNGKVDITNISKVFEDTVISKNFGNITRSTEYTVISMVYDNHEINSSLWINFRPNAYVEQNGKKYYLIKAEGIPISPNKFFFKTQSILYFYLYFDKSINLNEEFNLIEIQNDKEAFNFYNISK